MSAFQPASACPPAPMTGRRSDGDRASRNAALCWLIHRYCRGEATKGYACRARNTLAQSRVGFVPGVILRPPRGPLGKRAPAAPRLGLTLTTRGMEAPLTPRPVIF